MTGSLVDTTKHILQHVDVVNPHSWTNTASILSKVYQTTDHIGWGTLLLRTARDLCIDADAAFESDSAAVMGYIKLLTER